MSSYNSQQNNNKLNVEYASQIEQEDNFQNFSDEHLYLEQCKEQSMINHQNSQQTLQNVSKSHQFYKEQLQQETHFLSKCYNPNEENKINTQQNSILYGNTRDEMDVQKNHFSKEVQEQTNNNDIQVFDSFQNQGEYNNNHLRNENSQFGIIKAYNQIDRRSETMPQIMFNQNSHQKLMNETQQPSQIQLLKQRIVDTSSALKENKKLQVKIILFEDEMKDLKLLLENAQDNSNKYQSELSCKNSEIIEFKQKNIHLDDQIKQLNLNKKKNRKEEKNQQIQIIEELKQELGECQNELQKRTKKIIEQAKVIQQLQKPESSIITCQTQTETSYFLMKDIEIQCSLDIQYPLQQEDKKDVIEAIDKSNYPNSLIYESSSSSDIDFDEIEQEKQPNLFEQQETDQTRDESVIKNIDEEIENKKLSSEINIFSNPHQKITDTKTLEVKDEYFEKLKKERNLDDVIIKYLKENECITLTDKINNNINQHKLNKSSNDTRKIEFIGDEIQPAKKQKMNEDSEEQKSRRNLELIQSQLENQNNYLVYLKDKSDQINLKADKIIENSEKSHAFIGCNQKQINDINNSIFLRDSQKENQYLTQLLLIENKINSFQQESIKTQDAFLVQLNANQESFCKQFIKEYSLSQSSQNFKQKNNLVDMKIIDEEDLVQKEQKIVLSELASNKSDDLNKSEDLNTTDELNKSQNTNFRQIIILSNSFKKEEDANKNKLYNEIDIELKNQLTRQQTSPQKTELRQPNSLEQIDQFQQKRIRKSEIQNNNKKYEDNNKKQNISENKTLLKSNKIQSQNSLKKPPQKSLQKDDPPFKKSIQVPLSAVTNTGNPSFSQNNAQNFPNLLNECDKNKAKNKKQMKIQIKQNQKSQIPKVDTVLEQEDLIEDDIVIKKKTLKTLQNSEEHLNVEKTQIQSVPNDLKASKNDQSTNFYQNCIEGMKIKALDWSEDEEDKELDIKDLNVLLENKKKIILEAEVINKKQITIPTNIQQNPSRIIPFSIGIQQSITNIKSKFNSQHPFIPNLFQNFMKQPPKPQHQPLQISQKDSENQILLNQDKIANEQNFTEQLSQFNSSEFENKQFSVTNQIRQNNCDIEHLQNNDVITNNQSQQNTFQYTTPLIHRNQEYLNAQFLSNIKTKGLKLYLQEEMSSQKVYSNNYYKVFNTQYEILKSLKKEQIEEHKLIISETSIENTLLTIKYSLFQECLNASSVQEDYNNFCQYFLNRENLPNIEKSYAHLFQKKNMKKNEQMLLNFDPFIDKIRQKFLVIFSLLCIHFKLCSLENKLLELLEYSIKGGVHYDFICIFINIYPQIYLTEPLHKLKENQKRYYLINEKEITKLITTNKYYEFSDSDLKFNLQDVPCVAVPQTSKKTGNKSKQAVNKNTHSINRDVNPIQDIVNQNMCQINSDKNEMEMGEIIAKEKDLKNEQGLKQSKQIMQEYSCLIQSLRLVIIIVIFKEYKGCTDYKKQLKIHQIMTIIESFIRINPEKSKFDETIFKQINLNDVNKRFQEEVLGYKKRYMFFLKTHENSFEEDMIMNFMLRFYIIFGDLQLQKWTKSQSDIQIHFNYKDFLGSFNLLVEFIKQTDIKLAEKIYCNILKGYFTNAKYSFTVLKTLQILNIFKLINIFKKINQKLVLEIQHNFQKILEGSSKQYDYSDIDSSIVQILSF